MFVDFFGVWDKNAAVVALYVPNGKFRAGVGVAHR
jgi:hypothetical protein